MDEFRMSSSGSNVHVTDEIKMPGLAAVSTVGSAKDVTAPEAPIAPASIKSDWHEKWSDRAIEDCDESAHEAHEKMC